ncbi:MAG: thioredoxin family protein [Saprospiraceae bacterium]
MKNKTIFTTLLLTISIVYGVKGEQSQVSFFEGTVEGARDKAKNESKLYFIEFHAKWCEPCKWMDENTFKNAALSNYVDKNYVPVKVDVENLDGFVWKQKYKVSYLPTIIVLNSQGTVLGKYEKSLPANDLLRILQNHRSSPMTPMESGVPATVSGPVVLNSKPIPVKTTTESEPKPAFISVHREPGLPKASEVQTRKPEISKSKTMATTAPTSPVIAPQKPPKDALLPFRVQVGVYSDAVNMLSEVNKLRKTFSQSVQVFNFKNKVTNAVTYRITIGQFASREDAASFAQELKGKGVTGVVKHISELDPKI